ncbi:hypothetical protein K9D10_001725 [Enterococcus faecalis]|nr:hypothetical protein [Enterococcus faecalis]
MIKDVNSANFLTTLSSILALDAQLQIMIGLLAHNNYLVGNPIMSEEEILQCASFDSKFYYLEQFGYRLSDKKPHTILHFL